MPSRIPFESVPEVRPSGPAAPTFNIQPSPQAFGAEIGRTLAGAGAEGEQHAVRWQQIQNQANVDDTYATKFSPEFRQMYTDYYRLQGKDAIDQLPAYMKKAEEIRERHADSLPNFVQRHLFNQVSRRRIEIELDGMSRYADAQNKVWQANTSDAFLKSQRDAAADHYNDEAAFGNNIGAGIAEIDRYGALTGQSAEKIKERGSQFQSAIWTDRIRRMMLHDPLGAQKLYQDNIGSITEADNRFHLEHELKSSVMPVEARRIADAAISSIPATKVDVRAHVGEWAKAAEAEAEKLHPGDAVFKDMVVGRVHNYANTIATAQQGLETQARSQLFLAAMSGARKDRPTDLDVLLTQPGMQDAWNRADAQTRIGLQTLLDHNARGYDPPMTDDAMRTYYRLKGLAANDPGAFSRENLSSQFDALPHQLSLHLIDLQTRQDAKALVNEQRAIAIARAKQVAAPSVIAAGINPHAKPGSPKAELYDQFVGRLQENLDTFYDTNKRAPNDSEIRDMTNSLLVQGKTPGGWWDSSVRAFQVAPGSFYVPPPKAEREKIIADFKAERNGAAPTEADIRRIYTAAQLRKKH